MAAAVFGVLVTIGGLIWFVGDVGGDQDASISTSTPTTADGSPISEWQSSPESEPLGWAPDGHAIVALGHGLCGHSAAEPGVHLLDPTTGATERIYESDPHERFLIWIARYPHTNGPERLAIQALDDLGYEQCRGDPSHGGGGVSTGAVFEETNLAMSGAPTAGSSLSDIESPERVEFGPGEAVVYGSDTDRTIGFLCGDFTWSISWIFSPPPADVDKMVRLGETLLPHLACTLTAPPP